MKRMITKIAAFALICTMLTGCASNSRKSRDDDDDDDTDKTEAVSETTEEPAETSETPAHTEKSEPTTTTTEGTTATSGTTSYDSGITLEEAMNQPELKKQLDDQIQSLMNDPTYKDMFKKIEWKAEGNDLTYAYYYAQKFSKDQIKQIKANLETQGDTLKTTVENLKSQIELSMGVRPATVSYVYYDGNDTEIAKLTY